MSSPIDLTRLPAPDIIEPLDYEVTLAARKAAVVAEMPVDQQDEVAATLELESEPMTKLLEENVTRDLALQNRINVAARAVLLAYARGGDLDQLGANFNTERLTITPADPTVNPPVAEVKEDDDAFQPRIQEAFDGLSVAGPTAAYEFFARSAHGHVRDARCTSPAPCEIVISVLSTEGDGTADRPLIDAVDSALSAETVRPVGDLVTVQSAEIISYEIDAVLVIGSGPESSIITQAAQQSVLAESVPKRPLGRSVYLSKLDAALHVEGVVHVIINSPPANIILTKLQAAFCTGIRLTAQVQDV